MATVKAEEPGWVSQAGLWKSSASAEPEDPGRPELSRPRQGGHTLPSPLLTHLCNLHPVPSPLLKIGLLWTLPSPKCWEEQQAT